MFGDVRRSNAHALGRTPRENIGPPGRVSSLRHSAHEHASEIGHAYSPRMKRLLVLLAACGASSKPGPGAGPASGSGSGSSAAAPASIVIPKASGPGKVTTEHFHSDALGVDKDYVVYLPGGYGVDPAARWPVIYYLHGLGGDETNWTQMGDLGGAADQLGLAAIVVMPDGDDGFYANSVTPRDYDACMKDGTGLFQDDEDRAHTCVKKADYEDYIVKDLVAHVDATYATIRDRRARGIAGMSMGGFGALELAMRHTDLFSAAASHSGVDALLYLGPHPYEAGKAQITDDVSTWGVVVEPIGRWVRAIFGPDRANWEAHDPAVLAQKLAPGALALYLDCGTNDVFGLDAEAAYLHDVLTARGIAHSYFIGPGRHDFTFWKPRIPHSLAFFAAHFAGQPAPVEEPAPASATAAPALEVTILGTQAGDGVPSDMVDHLVEGVTEAARGCVAQVSPTPGVREMMIGVTDKADLADVQWRGGPPHDALRDCMMPPPPRSVDPVRYVYIAFDVAAPKTLALAPPALDLAHDLDALCHSKADELRHPEVLAAWYALGNGAKAKPTLAPLLAKAKLSVKKCPLAK
jgi:S-formylglutathione hydrolase FrmB